MLISFYATATDQSKLERIHWEKDINKTTTLVFKNHYGNIRLRSTSDQKLIVHGVAQESKKHAVKLDFIEKDNQIIAEVMFTDSETLPEDHRFDAVIIVPSTLNLDLNIENGELSSKGLKSQVRAQSINSNISIKSTKNVDLFSQNGDVSFYAKSTQKTTNHKLKSHKGDVNVYYLNQTKNQFTTLAGTENSSNDPKLLNSIRNQGRENVYGTKDATNLFNLQTDTGFIRMINQKHQ